MRYKATLIIGNGFDLSLGLKTSFKDFHHYLKDQGFYQKHREHELAQMLDKACEKDKWFDFEAIIKEYAITSNDSLRLTSTVVSEEEKTGIKENAIGVFSELKTHLYNFLKPTDNEDDHLNISFAKIFYTLLGAKTDSMSSICNKIYGAYDTTAQQYVFDVPTRIVSFNYTDTFWLLGWKCQHAIPTRIPTLRSSNINYKLWRIHGNLIPDKELIFGTDDNDNIPKEFSFFKKVVQYGREKRSERMYEILSDSKIVVIFGQSIHGIDYEYYHKFLEEDGNQEIYIITGFKKDKELIDQELERNKIKRP